MNKLKYRILSSPEYEHLIFSVVASLQQNVDAVTSDLTVLWCFCSGNILQLWVSLKLYFMFTENCDHPGPENRENQEKEES